MFENSLKEGTIETVGTMDDPWRTYLTTSIRTNIAWITRSTPESVLEKGISRDCTGETDELEGKSRFILVSTDG